MAGEQRKVDKYWFDHQDKKFAVRYYRGVVNDIKLNQLVRESITKYRKSFIRFCAVSRLHFTPDILAEFSAYHKRFRLGYTNPSEWEKIRRAAFERDGFTCQYCGTTTGPLEADHIIPFSKGGGNDLSNITTACRPCNRRKKDRSVEEFINNK